MRGLSEHAGSSLLHNVQRNMKRFMPAPLLILVSAACAASATSESSDTQVKLPKALQGESAFEEPLIWTTASWSPSVIRKRESLIEAIEAKLAKSLDSGHKRALEGYKQSLLTFKRGDWELPYGAVWVKISSELTTRLTLLSPPIAADLRKSQEHYRAALSHYERGEFERAVIEARKAVASWGDHVAARKMIEDFTQMTLASRWDYFAIDGLIETLASPDLSAELKRLAKEHNEALKAEVLRLAQPK
jgi:hypothetical protein